MLKTPYFIISLNIFIVNNLRYTMRMVSTIHTSLSLLLHDLRHLFPCPEHSVHGPQRSRR